MMTENILMEEVKLGGDRQALHEKIRVHSMAAGKRVKEEGLDCDLLDRIAADDDFSLDRGALEKLMDPTQYTGRSKEQVEEYLAAEIWPLLESERCCFISAR